MRLVYDIRAPLIRDNTEHLFFSARQRHHATRPAIWTHEKVAYFNALHGLNAPIEHEDRFSLPQTLTRSGRAYREHAPVMRECRTDALDQIALIVAEFDGHFRSRAI